MSLLATSICLIACHGGPADHFATFAENLVKEGYEVQVYGSGPGFKKFQDRNINVLMDFKADGLSEIEESDLARTIAKKCSNAAVVLIDVGHSFDITLNRALALEAPEVLRLAYYDNPEPYVPGGYSSVASKVMQLAQKTLFANANLAEELVYEELGKEIHIPFQNRVGLGYYPIIQAENLAEKRMALHGKMRADLFSKHKIEDKGQKVLVYFGGNNETYFTKAFPAFLKMVSEGAVDSDLSNFVIVMQQHPGAKSKNIDRIQIEAWIKEQGGLQLKIPQIVISEGTTEDMQIVADAALYYQTSMGPLFALGGIPAVQVGHESFNDILVRGGLCSSATNTTEFLKAITSIKSAVVSEEQKKLIFSSLGIREDWYLVFKQALVIEKSERFLFF